MAAKIINMQGEDISPVPLSPEEELKQQFAQDLVETTQSLPFEVAIDVLFKKYNISLSLESK